MGVVNDPAIDAGNLLVPAFGPALPDDVRQKTRAKADAAVRKAAEGSSARCGGERPGRPAQNAANPGTRGYGIASRMFANPHM